MNDERETDLTSLWQSRGWMETIGENKNVYSGYYLALDKNGQIRSFEGRIEMVKYSELKFTDSGIDLPTREAAKVYIISPPPEIKNHPHSHCFALISKSKGKRIFYLHFESQPPSHVDTAISFMEKLLAESFNPKLLESNA